MTAAVRRPQGSVDSEPVVWDVIYYEAADGRAPAVEFLNGCPTKVAANLLDDAVGFDLEPAPDGSMARG